MRNCLSPPPNIKSTSYFSRNDNCECNCHFPEDCNDEIFALSVQENNNCNYKYHSFDVCTFPVFKCAAYFN